MKSLLVFVLPVLLLATSSCKKTTTVHPTNGFQSRFDNMKKQLGGEWQLVSDSISDSMLRASAVNSIYIGQTGDYFDFRADGYCYTKEGAVYDTLAYQLTGPNDIMLQKFGLIINGSTEVSNIYPSGNSGLTIITNNMYTPAGTLFRKVILKR